MRASLIRRMRTYRRYWATLFALGVAVAPRLALAANNAIGSAAPVGPTSISTALQGVQGLLYHIALPASGVGLATGGVWHSVSHNPQSQEQSKTLMKASLVGAGVTVLASAIIGAFSSALGA